MPLSRLAELLRGKRRLLDSLQVELTTDCLLRCPVCPRQALGARWQTWQLSPALYGRLGAAFSLAESVHFEGWGEPLLHADFLPLVEVAKAAGCAVGFTTNGVLLREELARQLLALDVDLVVVTIAGAHPATHAALRVGSHLPTVVDNVAALARLKEQQGSPRPKIVASFALQRRNVAELPAAVDLARAMGAQELAATNLDCIVDERHDAATAFAPAGPEPAWASYVEEARRQAARQRIAWRPSPLVACDDVPVCGALPTRTAVVAADGGVFPCRHLALPAASIPRLFRGEHHEVARRPFGNLAADDLAAVWRQREYRTFRAAFARRQRLGALVAREAARGAESAVEAATRGAMPSQRLAERAPLPEVCRTCYKAYGL